MSATAAATHSGIAEQQEGANSEAAATPGKSSWNQSWLFMFLVAIPIGSVLIFLIFLNFIAVCEA